MSLDPHVRDPLYKYDTHYPDRLSRLHAVSECPSSAQRRTKVMRPRVGIRYRTQPVTFDEIQEVDDEADQEQPNDMDAMKTTLTAFSKSMDGLVSNAGGATAMVTEKTDKADQKTTNTDHLNLPMELGNARRPKKRNVKQKIVPD